MRNIPLIILGGFETRLKKIDKVLKRFLENYGVHYLEGQPKGITIKQNDEFLVQNIRNQYADSKFFDKDRIFIVGPEWLYESRLDGFKFVNNNNGLLGNLKAAFDAVGKGVVGITTHDLPLLKTEHINDYVSSVEGLLYDPNMASILQMVDNAKALKDYSNEYEKPGYPLKENKFTKNRRYAIGHLHFCNIDNINPALLRTVGLSYDIRGEGKIKQFIKATAYAFKREGIKKRYAIGNLPIPLIKYVPPLRMLTFDNLTDYLQKTLIDESLFKKGPSTIHIKVVDKPYFAFDLDTVEEVESLENAEYTPVEKIVNMEYKEVLRQSTISS